MKKEGLQAEKGNVSHIVRETITWSLSTLQNYFCISEDTKIIC